MDETDYEKLAQKVSLGQRETRETDPLQADDPKWREGLGHRSYRFHQEYNSDQEHHQSVATMSPILE